MRTATIASHPAIEGGELLLRDRNRDGPSTRVVTLLDRIDAGDSVADVAEDFGVEPARIDAAFAALDQEGDDA